MNPCLDFLFTDVQRKFGSMFGVLVISSIDLPVSVLYDDSVCRSFEGGILIRERDKLTAITDA
jgi:hypothetical protein